MDQIAFEDFLDALEGALSESARNAESRNLRKRPRGDQITQDPDIALDGRIPFRMGDDRDHFDTRYFGKGFRWQLPDLDTSEVAYRMAHKAYANDNRRILDATVGGKLTVFPKLDYDSLF